MLWNQQLRVIFLPLVFILSESGATATWNLSDIYFFDLHVRPIAQAPAEMAYFSGNYSRHLPWSPKKKKKKHPSHYCTNPGVLLLEDKQSMCRAAQRGKQIWSRLFDVGRMWPFVGDSFSIFWESLRRGSPLMQSQLAGLSRLYAFACDSESWTHVNYLWAASLNPSEYLQPIIA